mmetsp:Transcript_23248/g.32564  ORF Transcript_23248/g.32564 Transcript_23248/m.32564 type:complete len:128 (+) Transcript_23248:138-521(+)
MFNKDMKILVVDDFETKRRMVSHRFRDLGFNNIQEADDGLTALPMLQKGDFEFVAADWHMPGMQGIDLLKHIRANDDLKHIPVLLFASEATREQIVEAAQSGVNGYILTPFEAVNLKEQLDKIFVRL